MSLPILVLPIRKTSFTGPSLFANSVKRRKLTQTKAADVLGLKQLDVSALDTGRIGKFSIDRLVRCLDRLDYKVDLVGCSFRRVDDKGRLRVHQESEPFQAIVGEKLSAITFVLDYWQLQFDGPSINALTRLEVSASGHKLRDGDDQFRNLFCGQIGKVVSRVTLRKPEAFKITFEDQSSISISLKWDDYRCPEAMIFYGPNLSSCLVVRADG